MKRRLGLRLRECLALHEKRTGVRLTHSDLAEKTGLSLETIRSIASRPAYNATLQTVELLCVALKVTPRELLAWRE